MWRLLSGLVLVTCSVCAQDAVRVLEQRCWGCHGPSLAQSGLRLDSREAVLKGGSRGPAVVAGQPSQSRLVQAIRRTGEPGCTSGGEAAGCGHRGHRELDCGRRSLAEVATCVVVVHEAIATGSSGVEGSVGADAHRRVHRGEAQRAEAQASEGGRSKDAGAAGVSGPARAASYERAGGKVCGGSGSGCL